MSSESNEKNLRSKSSLRYDGIVLLQTDRCTPSVSDPEAIAAFYRDAFDKEEEAIQSLLLPALTKRYEVDDDRRKQYRFPPFYLFSHTLVTLENDRLLSTRHELRLTHRNRILFHKVRGLVWDKTSGLLLVPRHVLRLTKEVRQAAKGAAFYLKENEAVMERDGKAVGFPFARSKIG